MNKDAEIWCVFGRRGSGKSTITKGIVKDASRKKVVVFDPQKEYAGAGWAQVSNLSDLLNALKKKWSSGFKISYVPNGDLKQQLHDLCSILEMVQAPYEAGKDDRKLTLVIEEANLSVPVHGLKSDQQGALRAALQGRHWGMDLVLVSQRPALVDKNIRSNAALTFVFPLAEQADIKQVMSKVLDKGRTESELVGMQKFNFWQIKDGQVRTGKTKKTGGYTLT